jgi:stage V sporulation protein S
MNLIKVSATSRTAAVAGAIAGVVREHHRAEVQAIGAGAVNQAIKALILATGYLRLDGIQVSCVPEFAEVTIDDKERTAIKLVVEPERSPNTSDVSKLQSTGVELGVSAEKGVTPATTMDENNTGI